VKTRVIQIYSPLNDRSDEDKEAFYELLQREIDARLSHHLLILFGNANAKVGSDKISWEGTMGNKGSTL